MSDGLVRAVVFDLDGLLVDSEPVQIAAWETFLAECGHRLDEGLLGELFGLRLRDSARLLRDRLGLPLSVEAIVAQRDAHFFAALPGRLHPMPGARELVAALRARAVPLALATSGHRRYVDLVLAALELAGAFAVAVTGDDVVAGKPAPDIYLAAATGLGLPPGCCLALEDAPHGVAAAKVAGLRCLAVPNAMTASLPGLERADAILTSLHEVLPWLDERGWLSSAGSRDGRPPG
ncbi:MAG: HAD family phosphatase [Sphaerobacter sp.]|nr:HAD family phosphatase [Sphaerobacter sp.]